MPLTPSSTRTPPLPVWTAVLLLAGCMLTAPRPLPAQAALTPQPPPAGLAVRAAADTSMAQTAVPTPPLSPGDCDCATLLIAETLGGTLGSALGGLGGGLGGAWLLCRNANPDSWCPLVGGMYGALAGSTIGSAAGAFLLSPGEAEDFPWAGAAIGSAAGAAAGGALALAFDDTGQWGVVVAYTATQGTMTALGATVARRLR